MREILVIMFEMLFLQVQFRGKKHTIRTSTLLICCMVFLLLSQPKAIFGFKNEDVCLMQHEEMTLLHGRLSVTCTACVSKAKSKDRRALTLIEYFI